MNDEKSDSRIELVCSDITYEIATGVFLPDQKLPTIREAVKRWQMDHRLVSKAYKRLERLGLVKSVPRSGYFVAVGTSHEIVSRHRFELQSMFDRVLSEISQSTKLSILGTFRYLANLAEIQARANPECVFVECTLIQASGHAEEITNTLSIPCLPMTIDQIGGKLNRIPHQVKTVLVTGFHYAELQQWRSCKRFNLLSVPIQVDPKLIQHKGEQAVLFEAEQSQAEHMGADLQQFLQSAKIRTEVVSDIDAALSDVFKNRKQKSKIRAYLSPRLWGEVSQAWRDHENVELTRFRIAESAWPAIADAMALPLGTMASFRS
jgi:DNA-binding transcriptional regulator YhcF (GntR family)